MNHFSILHLIGAVGFFLYGLHLTEEGLRLAMGDRFRLKVSKLTHRRMLGFLLGVLMTMVLQSSTATTIMLVGLASVGVLGVKQAISVVLGADVGTTLLVVLIASLVRWDTSTFAIGIITLGFISNFLFRHGRRKFFAQALLGFGFVFFGLNLISASSFPLKQSQLFREVIAAISESPGVALFVGALVTGLLQSSAAVLGIVLSLTSTGLMTALQAAPFVLGANLGSTVGPLIVSLGSQVEGKRVAYVHFASKALGVMLFLPFLSLLTNWIGSHVASPPFQVATLHIVFNVVLASLFLPWVTWIERGIKKLVPGKKESNIFGPTYLDPHVLESPTLAFANVFRELIRMAEIAQVMCASALKPLESYTKDNRDRIEELDNQIDCLDREIKFYMAKISEAQLTGEQANQELELLMLTHDLESIGDVISNDLMELAEKKSIKGLWFSEEGWKEIQSFHQMVLENFQLAITSLVTNNVEVGRKVMRHKKHLAVVEQELAQKHLWRLKKGLQESFDTSSLHLDVLTRFRRINSIVCKLAYPVLDQRGRK